ncbi:acylphosphatase [Nesterenkonia muleiensis]|uniref:acylphosphatase n=1 Tax=Nesterenkonia muleiensis TaxID=2282648 RepID=UPI00138FF408|nr:acylphosphatase [Nesterenkonia muleiensis]
MGHRADQEISTVGQAELIDGGEDLLMPAAAWEVGEKLLKGLLFKDVPLGDAGQAQAFIDAMTLSEASEIAELQESPGREAFERIRDAVKEAFVMFSAHDAPSRDDLGRMLETKLPQVNRYFVAPEPTAPHFQGEPANVFEDAPFIEPLPKDGTKGHLLEREALRYGMASTRYPNGAFVVTDLNSQKQLGFKWGRSPLASGVALSICSYKEATRRLLKRIDVPVPHGRVFSTADRDLAVQYADRIGYPVVCKPVAGLRGIGVVANIQNREELEDALTLYQQSQLGDDDFVIEEHVPGEDYRIVVIGDEVVASVVRSAASVTGDGMHTVADLIEYKNRARQENPHLSSRPITLSESLQYQLKLAGLTFSSIPEAGQTVLLANSANLSQGGDSFEIADEMHPSIKELAVKAVQAVPGLGFCGLDMLIEDHRKPVWEQRCTVIELNAHAAIGSAQYPMWGTPAPVAKKFFEATAAASEITLPEHQSKRLTLRFDIRGRVTGVGYRKWFGKRARRFGLTGYVKNASRKRVEAVVSGPADAVSALGYLATTGTTKAVITSVVMTPVEDPLMEQFQVMKTPTLRGLLRRVKRQVSQLF